MFVNWRGVGWTLAGISLALALALVDLRCAGGSEESATLGRVRDELAAGRREQRYQEAENLAGVARDLRALAARYAEKGEKRKARRAAAAAEDLERKISDLRKAAVR